ncbi:pantetheinase-like [Palaemon carinicauda]|uniref:pantetheinase-like n=1 Tax=Palaemon carinicauda TaxID=392227 RepID=UPI0035B5C2DE
MVQAVFAYLSVFVVGFLCISSQNINHIPNGGVNSTDSYATKDEEQPATEKDTIEYIAAVLDYEANEDTSQGGQALLQENARILLEYAWQAQRQGANIIVFPENGLTSSNTGTTFETILSRSQIVPEVVDEVIPCYYTDVNNASKVMQKLSCGAKELGMYLVVQLTEQQCANATVKIETESGVSYKQGGILASAQPSEDCPESDILFFNTQVVFSDIGMVVAKYRKKHLYVEDYFYKGEQPDEEAMFTTSFGVTFTLQICFDIMYSDPAVNNIEKYGLHDAILSTHWIDELPFLTAPQLWKAWSEGNKVNLLASNYFKPSQGAIGSGIFRGYTSEPATYVYNASSGTTLVVGKVTTSPVANVSSETTKSRRAQNFYQSLIDRNETGIQREILTTDKTLCELSNDSNILSRQTAPLHIAENHTFLHEDLRRYNHSLIEWTSTNTSNWTKSLCHEDGFCCTLEYDYPRNSSEEGFFMLFAYSGLIEKGGGIYSMYSKTCAVVFCLNTTVTSCARIEGEPVRYSTLKIYELRGNFSKNPIYPSVFMQNLKLYNSQNWVFNVEEHPDFFTGVLQFKETVQSLLSLTLFSRWYERDPQE